MEAADLTKAGLEKAAWRTSSYTSPDGGNCVEVADNLPGVIGVRDSKNRSGPALRFAPDVWRAFIAEVKSGSFDVAP
ncbi:DUF397 domain-containing protein [Spongiactinospora gelatinilytica]|uniref:DUF397 domain-containing protein n=1 Tax=Spongiactinospora gelatinilytica TaxID=2666298 RepID=A0A2W2F807_9ACTN|nr:DUF397 domain-containing protein [Spongiactinospora gelatinilytica]PZG32022.1 DUF397 domain-containing protein [Spongiactinospora gelatinilytica]